MDNRDFDISDVVFGRAANPEYQQRIEFPEYTCMERFKMFIHDKILPAFFLTLLIGFYSFFVASIFKWVLLR